MKKIIIWIIVILVIVGLYFWFRPTPTQAPVDGPDITTGESGFVTPPAPAN